MKSIIIGLSILASTQAIAIREYSSNQLIVKVKEGMKLPALKNSTNSKNLFGNMYVIKTSSLVALESELDSNESISYFQRDFKSEKRELAKPSVVSLEKENESAKGRSFFNDPKASRVWSFNSSEKHGVSVNKAYAARSTSTGSKIIVAVVDTGVDHNHEDLKNTMWVNTGEVAGNGIDDDGNGYIDDVHGINTIDRDEQGNATGNIMDTHSHGTHVSGTIGAEQNNGVGIAGIASNVEIMGIRTVPGRGDETDVNVIESFIYAAKNGAKIINCSFGKSVNEGGMAVSEAINFIGKEYGVLVIAAAGNDTSNIDSRLTYPASFENDNLLVVASTTKRGKMSYFSNYGFKNVDLAAPGSSVYSTVPGNRYQGMSGTSMAAPTTSGVAAEVLSRYPNLSNLELKKLLMETVTKLSRFKSKMVAGGRVDLDKALNSAELLSL